MNDDTANRLQSHFWITATTIGVHVFLMTDPTIRKFPTTAVAVGTFVWLMATFLITEIAAAAKRDVPRPEITGYDDKPFRRKGLETLWNLRLIYQRLWFTIVELKGGLFFTALVFLSFSGVWFSAGSTHPVRTSAAWLAGVLLASVLFDRCCWLCKWRR